MKDLNLFRMKDSVYLREVSNKAEVLENLSPGDDPTCANCDGFLIKSSEKEARSIIASLKDRRRAEGGRRSSTDMTLVSPKAEGGKSFFIALVGGDDAFNRRVIETLKIDYLVSPEAERLKVAGGSVLCGHTASLSSRHKNLQAGDSGEPGFRGFGGSEELKTKRKKDTLKQRDSGLNHVVARMAGEKGVGLVVDFGDIAGLKGKEKAERIARVMQNVKVCRKVGCAVKIASFGKSKKDVVDVKGRESFGVGLGMSSKEVADCVKF